MIRQDSFFKLEMLILSLLNDTDYTSEQLLEIIHQQSDNFINIKLGVLLTSLYFLEDAHLISSYQDQSIYYHIETPGMVRLETLKRRYFQMKDAITQVMDYKGENHG